MGDQDRAASPDNQDRPRGRLTIEIGTSTILIVIGLVLAAYLLFRIPTFWLIVLTAIVLATAIDRPVAALQARGIPRAMGILLIYFVLVALLATALGALAPIVASDARALQGELPGYVGRLEQALGSFSPGATGAYEVSVSTP